MDIFWNYTIRFNKASQVNIITKVVVIHCGE